MVIQGDVYGVVEDADRSRTYWRKAGYSFVDADGNTRIRFQIISVWNAREIATYIGTTLMNVYQMVSKTVIPFVKIGRSVRFDKIQIDAWIEGKKRGHQETQKGPQ